MSVDQLLITAEDAARYAVLKSGAVNVCPRHNEIMVRVGDPDAENKSYAIATNELKKSNMTFLREEVLAAIKHELEMAADYDCPVCADQGAS